jgi:hypothetical protein
VSGAAERTAASAAISFSVDSICFRRDMVVALSVRAGPARARASRLHRVAAVQAHRRSSADFC